MYCVSTVYRLNAVISIFIQYSQGMKIKTILGIHIRPELVARPSMKQGPLQVSNSVCLVLNKIFTVKQVIVQILTHSVNFDTSLTD